MTETFPYQQLNREQIIDQINKLSVSEKPFLFIIDYKAETGFVIRQNELNEKFIRFETQNTKHQTQNVEHQTISWLVKPVLQSNYKTKFDFVTDQIHQGNSFLVNLTQPTEVATNLSLLDIYTRSSAKYKLWIKDKFTVLSPETLCRCGAIASGRFR